MAKFMFKKKGGKAKKGGKKAGRRYPMAGPTPRAEIQSKMERYGM